VSSRDNNYFFSGWATDTITYYPSPTDLNFYLLTVIFNFTFLTLNFLRWKLSFYFIAYSASPAASPNHIKNPLENQRKVVKSDKTP